MLVAAGSSRFNVPFVQIGEIRDKNVRPTPAVFVAYRKAGGSLVYQDFGAVSEGEHTVSITGDRRTINLTIGRRHVERFDRALFFHRGDRPYYQFASEVDGAGDVPAGYFRNIEVKDDRWPSSKLMKPDCLYHSRGLRIRRADDLYVLSGRYVSGSKESRFEHCGYTKGWKNDGRQS